MRNKRNFLFLVLILIIVTITSPVQAKTKIALNAKKKTLEVGKTYTLKVKGTKKKVKWSTSKKSVATVSKKGKVKAKKAGTAIIKAKVAGKTLQCKIIVKKKKTTAKTTEKKKDTNKTSTTDKTQNNNNSNNNNNGNTDPVKPETPPEEPAEPVDETFNKLVDYINNNGESFDEHMMAIRRISTGEDSTEMSVIAYDSENKQVVLMYMAQGGALDQFTYMYIKSSDPNETTNLCHGVENGDDSYVVLTPDFAKSAYSPEAFSYTVAGQTGAFAENESFRNMAEDLFKESETIIFNEWNKILEPAGLTMKDLGFSLIN